MGRTLKIITKVFKVLRVQDLVPFQIISVLCGWDIITSELSSKILDTALSLTLV
jgi:hypothetical protein